MGKLKKVIAAAVALCMGTSVVLFAGCSDEKNSVSYTYTVGTTALATNWNPHTWETNSDNEVLSFITSPLVDLSVSDSEEGIYTWVYEMATKVEDVTATHREDLVQYVGLTEAQAAEVSEGYVYEISLNEDAAWENGKAITADDYIYSMQQLISSQMKNYRANLYIAGESALAGAYNYYYAGESFWADNGSTGKFTLDTLVKGDDGVYTDADNEELVISYKDDLEWLDGYSLETYVETYGSAYFGVESYNKLVALDTDNDGRIAVTDDSITLLEGVITAVAAWGETKEDVVNYMLYYTTIPEADWDTVGLYKVDDYTIRYVCATYLNWSYFMTSLTDNWLVYKDLYEDGKTTTGTLVTTNYGTTVATTMAYGPYKLSSLDVGSQMRLVQNENWYGYETVTDDDGNESLISYTNFLVDGEYRQQYQTTQIVFNVMTEDTMQQAFFRGEISEWTPSSDQLSAYTLSPYLYQIDETYTMSLFFNTDLTTLQSLDRSGGNTNSVVLSNYNFRKAFSLAINRSEWVNATPGYSAAYALMNNLYYYDIYNDPESNYRSSAAAMEAICRLYDVEWGEGTAYATLEDAYNSINGYNLTEAQELMKKACEELVDAGLYSAGQDIKIRVAWSAGALTSDDNSQIALLNEYLNAAAEGSGFGTITLEPIGNLSDRYSAVPNGTYAIGYGAWGGAAFYPFRNFQVYMDPDQYSINESGCWDPTEYTFTLEVPDWDEAGNVLDTTSTVTMTAQAWSNSMTGNGAYATAPFEVQLSITAQLEYEFLNFYYRIPLANVTSCFLLSQQLSYYTDNYNVMYGFGGFRLMSYNYTDAAWSDYVSSQGGTLTYV